MNPADGGGLLPGHPRQTGPPGGAELLLLSCLVGPLKRRPSLSSCSSDSLSPPGPATTVQPGPLSCQPRFAQPLPDQDQPNRFEGVKDRRPLQRELTSTARFKRPLAWAGGGSWERMAQGIHLGAGRSMRWACPGGDHQGLHALQGPSQGRGPSLSSSEISFRALQALRARRQLGRSSASPDSARRRASCTPSQPVFRSNR